MRSRRTGICLGQESRQIEGKVAFVCVMTFKYSYCSGIKSFSAIVGWLLIFMVHVVNAQVPAFPGAQGFGAHTPGGRGGDVIKVTNLNDSGEGSLRAALSATGPRIIIFETGGIITLRSKLEIRNPFVTIAGQTAPGSGIAIRGEGIRIITHDVIIRFLRIRPGEVDFSDKVSWSSLDGITIDANAETGESAYNVIIDHCSISWSIDENIGIWDNARNITIQYSIISEGLQHSRHKKGPHSMGVLIGHEATNISMHHNILAHNNDRNPLVNGNTILDFRNNLIYGAGTRATSFGINAGTDVRSQKVNYVGNIVIPGPKSRYPHPITLKPENIEVLQLFLKDNIWESPDQSEKSGLSTSDVGLAEKNSTTNIKDMILSNDPFDAPGVRTLSARNAYNFVLKNAGANIPARDAVDGRIISQIKNKTGRVINTQNQVGGWPVFNEGIAPLDKDGDGMNDYWEEQNGFNPNIADGNLDRDEDGYTNLEEYLNGTSPEQDGSISGDALNEFFQNEKKNETQIKLHQNFPNPFNSRTTVHFTLNKPTRTNMEIYNLSGKRVAKLVDSFLLAGRYEVFWNADRFSSGVYILRLSTSSTQQIEKVTLIK